MTLAKQRNYELVLPTHYVDVDQDDMEYVDGGWKISSSDVRGIAASLCIAGPIEVAAMAAAIQSSAGTLMAMLSVSAPGIGFLVGGAASAIVLPNAWKFAEAFTTAAIHNKGLDIYIGFKWGIVPDLKIDVIW